ncbi:MAG: ScyD/ScyE family protein [Chloroflexota bacterium]|nr:ScyD/ScyE family protein [Chloroflexota bacterium]
MSRPARLFHLSLVCVVAAALLPTVALAQSVPEFPFKTPVFGLATAPDGSLLVADAGAGVVELRKGSGQLIANLPGVVDVSAIGRGNMFAVTGAPDGKLYRVARGSVRQIADLAAFEARVNPDQGEIDSNPFDVEALSGGSALVVDAGGNDLLIVDQQGHVDWVATFPDEPEPTAYIKQLLGCPNAPAELAFACGLPPVIPSQAVPTSVAVGPDGAYYVTELKGFPFQPGSSRIWRVAPGTRHARCGTSPACSVVASGFTSIVDLTFGPNGAAYVVEMDEASAVAVELGGGGSGGTVNRCGFPSWTCTVVRSGLPIPIAVAVDRKGSVYVVISALVPGQARVITLP